MPCRPAVGLLLIAIRLLTDIVSAEQDYEKRAPMRLESQETRECVVENVTNEWKKHWVEIMALVEMAGEDAVYTDDELHEMGLPEGEEPPSPDVLLLAAYCSYGEKDRFLCGATLIAKYHDAPCLGRLAKKKISPQEKRNFKRNFRSSMISKLHYMGMISVDSALQRQNIATKLVDEGMRLLKERRKEEFQGLYAFHRTTNVRGLIALNRAIQTRGAELWGVTKVPIDKLAKLGPTVKEEKKKSIADLCTAVTNTAVTTSQLDGKEDTRIATIRGYMEKTTDLDYYVWILEKDKPSIPTAPKPEPIAPREITVTFREVKTPSEHAAAVSLVYSVKLQESDRLAYDTKFLALGAFAEGKLLAVAVVTKDEEGEYEFTDVVTSAAYTPMTTRVPQYNTSL